MSSQQSQKKDRGRNSLEHDKVLKVKLLKNRTRKLGEDMMICLPKFKLLATVLQLGWRG